MNLFLEGMKAAVSEDIDCTAVALAFIDGCIDFDVPMSEINDELERAIYHGLRARIMETAAELVHERKGPGLWRHGLTIVVEGGDMTFTLPVELVPGGAPPYIRGDDSYVYDRVLLRAMEYRPGGVVYFAPLTARDMNPAAVVIGTTSVIWLAAWSKMAFDPPDRAA